MRGIFLYQIMILFLLLPFLTNIYTSSENASANYNELNGEINPVELESNNLLFKSVLSDAIPNIIPQFSKLQYNWGSEIDLLWSTVNANQFSLLRNGTEILSGIISSDSVILNIQTEDKLKWLPGIYNITLVITDLEGNSDVDTYLISIIIGDPFANSFVSKFSQGGSSYQSSVGEPDGNYTELSVQYFNGFITLDMGFGENIVDELDYDFKVIAKGGKYILSISDSLSNFEKVDIFEGNSSIDLQSINIQSIRYVRIEYVSGDNTLLDGIIAFNFEKYDNKAPLILKSPGDIDLNSENSSFSVSFELYEVVPAFFEIYLNNKLIDEFTWIDMNITISVDIGDLDGEIRVKFIFYDLLGQFTNWEFSVFVDKSVDSNTENTRSKLDGFSISLITTFVLIILIFKRVFKKLKIKQLNLG